MHIRTYVGATSHWEFDARDGPEGRLHEVHVWLGAGQHWSLERVYPTAGSG